MNLFLPSAYASAVVEQRQQMMRQQQQEAIRQKQQQLIQQQQQAYQQALIQRQQAQQQLQKQAVQQRAAQQQAYNQAVEDKMKDVSAQRQTVAQDAQAQAAAQMRSQKMAYQQQMQQLGVLMSQQAAMPAPQIPNVQAPGYGDLFYEPPVEEVVDIADVWKKMEENSQAWGLMIDMQPKVMTVQRMIDRFKADNIYIRKSPDHYVQIIDSMAFQSPGMLDQPFEQIMKIVAVIEYDFENGQDKDALARQIFPDNQRFQANKTRLGL